MKINKLLALGGLLMGYYLQTGCKIDRTNFYADQQDTGLSIFSNKFNNVMSGYLQGKVWRTEDRVVKAFGGRTYEVYINKQHTNGSMDTLLIVWNGHFSNDRYGHDQISLQIPVVKQFGSADLLSLSGRRLSVDGTNGLFTYSINSIDPATAIKGTGDIYFYSVQFDSTGTGQYTGSLQGLLEVKFDSLNLTHGRFDHGLEPGQVVF